MSLTAASNRPLPDLITGQDYDEAATGSGQLYRLAAMGAIRRYCGWHIAPVISQTLILDGSGRQVLLLPTLRLKSVEAVKEHGRAVPLDGIEWSHKGILRRRTRWTDRLRGVEVSLHHGFDDTPQLSALVVSVAERARASPAGVVSESAGAVNIRFSTFGSGAAGAVALMEHEYALLDQYRLPPR